MRAEQVHKKVEGIFSEIKLTKNSKLLFDAMVKKLLGSHTKNKRRDTAI